MHRIGDSNRGGDGACAIRRLRGNNLGQRNAELAEAFRVRARVAAASERQRERIGHATELLDDLECGGLLTLDSVGVERVDEDVRPAVGELTRCGERLVER